MAQNRSRRLLWAVCLAALAAFAAAMVWLHYQQLCSPGGGSDPYTSDLGMHLAFAQRGMVYSTVSLLIGPAYALAGRIGIAVLLAAFHLAAVAVFAYGLRTALPDAPRPARLLVSLVVNLATAVWMPRGGYWYQGTVGGTIYHNTTYIMLAPFALLAMLAFYRVWPTMRDDLDLRAYAVYTVLLTVATSFKASLIFAFAPALLVLLIADFVRTRAKNLKNEIIMGCSVFPGVALCFIQANVLFAEEGSGIRLIFTVPFDHHRMLWGPFNEAGVLGLARSFVFVAAVGLLLGRAAPESGAEAAMLQSAALALLGGREGRGLAANFGLDELSFSGGEGGSLQSASVTLGKRLSDKLYAAYEHSLAGASGTLMIFYELSRRWTLRGQAGENSAVDLIFRLSFD